MTGLLQNLCYYTGLEGASPYNRARLELGLADHNVAMLCWHVMYERNTLLDG